MVSECPSFVLAAVTAKPFAKLFQQTKSSCKAGEVVRVGFGRDFFFCSFVCCFSSEGSGSWQEEGNRSSQHQHQ